MPHGVPVQTQLSPQFHARLDEEIGPEHAKIASNALAEKLGWTVAEIVLKWLLSRRAALPQAPEGTGQGIVKDWVFNVLSQYEAEVLSFVNAEIERMFREALGSLQGKI